MKFFCLYTYTSITIIVNLNLFLLIFIYKFKFTMISETIDLHIGYRCLWSWDWHMNTDSLIMWLAYECQSPSSCDLHMNASILHHVICIWLLPLLLARLHAMKATSKQWPVIHSANIHRSICKPKGDVNFFVKNRVVYKKEWILFSCFML